MKIIIRQETPGDYQEVGHIIWEAFKYEQYSDQREHLLVDRLRNSDAFIPELSIVAEYKKEILGYILLTKIKINNENETFDSLALAPVSVKPKYQKKGIGGQLIKAAHKTAKEMGYQSIVLLGHENYYPKFGYERASKYGILLPFDAPDENCMVIELVEHGLNNVSGKVEYPKEFYE